VACQCPLNVCGGVTVAAVGPLALASRRVGGQGRADDLAVTGDDVGAEEEAMGGRVRWLRTRAIGNAAGRPYPVVGDPVGYADFRAGGGYPSRRRVNRVTGLGAPFPRLRRRVRRVT
jgi:hypothetical protein